MKAKLTKIFAVIGVLFVVGISVQSALTAIFPENYRDLRMSILRGSVGEEINVIAEVEFPGSKSSFVMERLHPSGRIFADLGFEQAESSQNDFVVINKLIDLPWPFSGITINGELQYLEDYGLKKYFFAGDAKMETVTGKYLKASNLRAEISASVFEKQNHTNLVLDGVIYSDHFKKISPAGRYLVSSRLDSLLMIYIKKYFAEQT